MKFIVVARKPLSGTVAANALKYGTGGINVDGCRVSIPETKRAAGTRTYAPGTMAGGKNSDPLQKAPHDGLGRWPANLILEHRSGCKCKGTKTVTPKEGFRPNPVNVQSDGAIQFSRKPAGYQKISYTNPDGVETTPSWECVPGCPIAELDHQSGDVSTQRTRTDPSSKIGRPDQFFGLGQRTQRSPGYLGETGGASRFFLQIQMQPHEIEFVRALTPDP